MSKTLKTVVTGAALATSLLAANAKADELVSTEATAQPQVAEASQQVTPASVKTAQEALEQADSVVKTQQTVVDKATETYTTANQAHTDAQGDLISAQELASQATPENIAKAEEAIENAKTTQITKETAVQTSQDAVKEAQDAVNNQAKVVESAKQATTKEEADVDVAKDKINEAEAAFDSATLLQAQQEAGRLDAKVKEEQKTVSDLKSNLASKEQEEADLIANGSKTRTELEQAVTSAGPEYYTEVVERELATHQVSESDAVSTPKDPTFIGKDGKTYYVVANENVLFDGEKVETIVLPNKEAFNQRKTVDYKKVSEYVREYIVELRRINGIDIPVPEVTESALKWAKARTEEMAKNDVLSHATDLKSEEFGLSGEIENISWGSLPVESTLDEKEIAYNQILRYFNDFNNVNNYGTESPDTVNWMNYGHRNTMLAASGTGFAIDATKGYGILTFVSTDGTGIYDEMPSILDPSTQSSYEYMGEIRYYYPSLAQDLGRAENKDSDPLRSEYYFNGKRIKFLPKTTFRYVWEETLYHKNTKREEAVAALATFNADQKTAELAIASAISTVKTDLATAQNQLSTDEKALKLANERVTALTSDNADKVRILKEAQNELTTQQSELKSAKEVLTKEEEELIRLEGLRDKAQENLTQAETGLEEAKKAARSAEQELLDLQNAPEKVKEAEAKLKEALQQLTDAKETLDRESALLETLQAERDAKQVIYDDLKAKQAIALDQERQAIEARGQEAKPVTDAAGKIIGYRAVDKAVSDLKAQITERYHFHITKAVTQKIAKSTTYKAKLPETGETETATMSLLGLGLLGLAAVGVKRRRN